MLTFAHRVAHALLAFMPVAQSTSIPAADRGEPMRPWTFLIYAAIDNDAEEDGNFFEFLDGVRRAYADEPGIEIVLFADRSDLYSANATSLGEDFADARLYRVRAGRCERLAGGAAFPEITLDGRFEPDSADPTYVRKFIAFGKAAFPARRYALMLYGHADGRAMCPDEQAGHEMGFAQLTDVVPAELGVDVMALELCNMAGIEIAYQWRPGNGGFETKTLVAIPNAGPPLDWDRVFARLRTGGRNGAIDPATLDERGLGCLIVEEGGHGRRLAAANNPRRAERLAHESVGCFDLRSAAAVKQAVDALSIELARGDSKAACAELRGPGPDGFALNYVRDDIRRDPYVDLFDLARRFASSDRLAGPARTAASAVAGAVDEFVLASYGGSALRRFEAGKCGIYITFPDGDVVVSGAQGSATLWSRCRWYSPARVPGVYGKLSWCRDGAKEGNGTVENWFELLDMWFDAAVSDGGSNRYAH